MTTKTNVGTIWGQIEHLLSATTSRAVLVAPFVKATVLESALAVIPPTVGDITCITRWSLAEVAAGVTDLEIMDVAEADGRPIAVQLRHDLHAKLYVSDSRCLVGSANLTEKGTGRSASPNLELLVSASTDDPDVTAVLADILARSTPATRDLADAVRAQAQLLADYDLALLAAGDIAVHQAKGWRPNTRVPERVFQVYRGDLTGCSQATLDSVLTDLVVLDLPPGLDKTSFDAAVRRHLYSLPEIAALRDQGRVTSADIEASLVAHQVCTPGEAAEAALIVTRWLLCFDPDLNTVHTGPYEIRRGRSVN